MITDPVVTEQLMSRDGFSDRALVKKLEHILDMKRHLDEAPTPVKLAGKSKADIIGTAAEFKAFYNKNYDSVHEDDIATIDLSEIQGSAGVKTCDYCVFVTLKTLIMLGVTKSTDRAKACRDWFMQIIGANVPHITKGYMYSMLESRVESTDYYSEVICESIIEATCTEEEQLKFHILLELTGEANKNELFEALMKEYKGLTPYEFDKKIKVRAKELRKDEHWMFERKVPNITVVGRSLTEKPLTAETFVRSYVTDEQAVSAILKEYGTLTPKKLLCAVDEVYMESHKKLAKPDKVLPFVGEKLCQK